MATRFEDVSTLNKDEFNAECPERFSVGGLDVGIGDDGMDGRWRSDMSQAAMAELAGVAYGNDLAAGLHHGAVHTRFEKIGGCDANRRIEAVYAEEKNVGVHLAQRIFSQWPHKRR